jgi:hypothetical protein
MLTVVFPVLSMGMARNALPRAGDWEGVFAEIASSSRAAGQSALQDSPGFVDCDKLMPDDTRPPVRVVQRRGQAGG